MESRIRGDMYVRFGGEFLETYHSNMARRWVLSLLMIQIIYSSILVILGPFSVAASILPAFRDSFSIWIGRFISVNLYSGIAYLVMYLCALMQEYAMQSEIARYQVLVGQNGTSADLAKLAWFAGNGILSFGTVIVVFIIGAICMLTVPSISTWIVSTSGISSAASGFGRGASSVARTAGQAAAGAL